MRPLNAIAASVNIAGAAFTAFAAITLASRGHLAIAALNAALVAVNLVFAVANLTTRAR